MFITSINTSINTFMALCIHVKDPKKCVSINVSKDITLFQQFSTDVDPVSG